MIFECLVNIANDSSLYIYSWWSFLAYILNENIPKASVFFICVFSLLIPILLLTFIKMNINFVKYEFKFWWR